MDQVTLIIDLEGFRISSGFIFRQLGWCTMKGENDSQHFYSPVRYKELSYKDRRTTNYVYRYIHGYASKPPTMKPPYRKEMSKA